MGQMVTIKDVAAKAGVHHSTVSLCLKNSPRIPAETKHRVLRAAKELGYHPHPFLSTLVHTRRRGRLGKDAGVIALVGFSHQWETWGQGFLSEAKARAGARGFRLEEFQASPQKSPPKRLAAVLFHRGIKGVLFAPMARQVDTLDWPWERFCMVALGPGIRNPGLHRVRHHHFQFMLTAMDECHRLGYRRVGLVIKEEVNLKLEERWLGGWILKQHELGIPNSPEPLITPVWNRSVFLEWVRAQQPDAVITINPGETRTWLLSAGYEIPQDIGLVSLASPRSGEQSGIYQDWPNLGKRSVSLLMDLMDDNLQGLHSHPYLILVNGIWNPGKTLRPQS